MQPENRTTTYGSGGREEFIEPVGRRPAYGSYRDEVRVRRTARPGLHRDDRSLGELFSELTRETQTLVRQEIELARTEAMEKAKKAGKNAGYIAAGGFVAYAGLIVFFIGVAYLLATFMSLWLATVITGLLVMLAGYVFLNKGMKGLSNTNFKLERTAETIREDKQWIREEI